MFLAALMVLGGAVAIQYRFPIFAILGVILGLGAILEVLAFRPRLFFAIILTFVEAFYISLLSIALGVSYQKIGQDGNLALLTTMYVSFLAITLLVLIGYFFSNGRTWLNLLIAYILFDSAFIFFVAVNLQYVYALALSFVIAVIFLAVKGITWKKSEPFAFIKRSPILLKKTRLLLEKESLTSESKDLEFIDFISTTEDKTKVFAILTLDIFRDFEIKGNEILVDGKIVTPILEELLLDLKAYSRENKVNPKSVIPVILSHKNVLPSNVSSVKVSPRSKPDRTLGTVYLVTPAGLASLIEKTPAITSKRDRKNLTK